MTSANYVILFTSILYSLKSENGILNVNQKINNGNLAFLSKQNNNFKITVFILLH